MWAILANLIGGPLVTGLINAYKAKLDAGNTSERIAADLAGRELVVEQREAEVNKDIIIAEEGRWWTSVPRALVQWSFALFVFKCVVYDNMLGLGTTDALNGDIHNWAGLVMAMWFGGRTLEKITRILKR